MAYDAFLTVVKAIDALAEANLLAEADIDEVRLHAPLELVEDCLSLAALFRRNEARIAGRSPVTAPDIREAEQVAEKLRTLLGQQGDASDGGTPSLVKIIEMRDRFWTLLKQRHDVLWRCGAWLFGRAVDERVPPLPVRQSVLGAWVVLGAAVVDGAGSSVRTSTSARRLSCRSCSVAGLALTGQFDPKPRIRTRVAGMPWSISSAALPGRAAAT